MTFLELCAIQPRAGGHERENTEWGLQRQGSASPSLALWSSACPVFQHYWEVWLPLLCSFNLLLIRTKILSITFFSRLSSPSPLSLYYQISSTPFIIFFSGTLSSSVFCRPFHVIPTSGRCSQVSLPIIYLHSPFPLRGASPLVCQKLYGIEATEQANCISQLSLPPGWKRG